MLEFFLAGGPAMLGITVCGLAALVAAIRFAISPDRRKVGAIACLSLAALASSLLGFAADLAAVCKNTPTRFAEVFETPVELEKLLLMGLAETLTPLILGFSLLTVIWLVMAVGYRRLAPRLPAV